MKASLFSFAGIALASSIAAMKKILLLNIFTFSFFICTFPVLSKPGDVDLTFNQTGQVFMDDVDTVATSIVVQPDGKIIVGGFKPSGSESFLIRYQPDGSVDTTFGENGVIITNFSNSNERVTQLLLQPDGKILVGGRFLRNPPQDFDLVFARFLPDGTLDPSFSEDGKLELASPTADTLEDFKLEEDGKIWVIAKKGLCTHIITKLNADGSFDDFFGRRGMMTLLNRDCSLKKLKVFTQTEGRLLFVGTLNTTSAILRLMHTLPDGSKDRSYGENAVRDVLLPESEELYLVKQVKLDSEGNLFVAGNINNGNDIPFFARLNERGELDTSFGGENNQEGRVIFSEDVLSPFVPRSVLFQSDQKIIIGGEREGDLSLVRLETNGALDSSFGIISADFGQDYFEDFALQSDGKILVTGYTLPEGEENIMNTKGVTIRYLAADTPSSSEGGDGTGTSGNGRIDVKSDVNIGSSCHLMKGGKNNIATTAWLFILGILAIFRIQKKRISPHL